MQGKYVFTFMVAFLGNLFVFKFDPLKFILTVIGMSIII